MRRGRVAAAAVVVLAVLAGGDFLLWRWTEGRLEQGLAAELAQLRAAGWQVATGRPVRGGWPLRARLTVPEVTLAGPAGAGPEGRVAWRVARLALAVDFSDPWRLVVDFGQHATLRAGGRPAIAIAATEARALIPLGARAPEGVLTLAGLRAGGFGLARARLALVPQPDGKGPDEGRPAVAISAERITLPPPGVGRRWALGPEIAHLAVTATLTGPIPLVGTPAARAIAWRDGGGTLALSGLALRWGPLGVGGRATIGLDGDLQPRGSARLRLVGQGAALDALAAAHVVARPAAQAAKAVLALMAHTPKAGGPAEVEMPLLLRGRVLALGEIPLLRLPALVWPGA